MKNIKVTQKDILFLSISMFCLVVAWIAFNLYHTYVTTTITEDLQMQVTPIDAKFDTETITLLKSRTAVQPSFDEIQTPQASAPATVSPTPTEIEPSPTATPESEDLTPTEEPVPSDEPTTTP